LFFVRGELGEALRGFGFGGAEDMDTARLNAKYLAGREDGLRLMGRVGRIMWARGELSGEKV